MRTGYYGFKWKGESKGCTKNIFSKRFLLRLDSISTFEYTVSHSSHFAERSELASYLPKRKIYTAKTCTEVSNVGSISYRLNSIRLHKELTCIGINLSLIHI